MRADLKGIVLRWGWLFLGISLGNSIASHFWEMREPNRWILYAMTLAMAVVLHFHYKRKKVQ